MIGPSIMFLVSSIRDESHVLDVGSTRTCQYALFDSPPNAGRHDSSDSVRQDYRIL